MNSLQTILEMCWQSLRSCRAVLILIIVTACSKSAVTLPIDTIIVPTLDTIDVKIEEATVNEIAIDDAATVELVVDSSSAELPSSDTTLSTADSIADGLISDVSAQDVIPSQPDGTDVDLPSSITKTSPLTSMVLIPAGPFKMGCVPTDPKCNGKANASEKPQHEVTLDAFYMDIYEVTAANYKICVDAGVCTVPDPGGTYGMVGNEQHPVTNVTWVQADDYCKWTHSKGRLPTEAQWEKAARGGLDDKIYPWGDSDPTCTPSQPNTAVYAINYGASSGICIGMTSMAVGTGSSPNGYGLFDMAGNAWEWVADWWDPKYYSNSPTTNPPGPAIGYAWIIRGGGYVTNDAENLRASQRTTSNMAYAGIGFRCIRSYP